MCLNRKGFAMKYRVAHHLKRDGKEYGPGDWIHLTEAESKQCGSALEPASVDETAEKAEKKRAAEEAEKKRAAEEAEKKGTGV
jgi:hypothetical protein